MEFILNFMSETFLLIDAHSLLHRAFHALPPLSSNQGKPTNAVYGLVLVLFKAIQNFKPSFIAAAFDLPGPTFRDELFENYKANRPKTPQSLAEQIPLAKDVFKALNIPIFELQGFEADDIIGTLTKNFRAQDNLEVIIVSGDLDVLQLAKQNIKVYTLKKGVKDTILYGEKEVKERFGFSPEQLADFKALKGDASDNIPGIEGIGEKTAKDLIQKFGSLEKIYEALEQNPKLFKESLVKKLKSQKDQAFLSKALALIRTDLPIKFNLNSCIWPKYDKEKAKELFLKLDFKSLIPRLP